MSAKFFLTYYYSRNKILIKVIIYKKEGNNYGKKR